MIGPTQGPIAVIVSQISFMKYKDYLLGPIIQTAIAVPRCSRGIKSAIVPPPRTIGAPPTAS
jgi:hypothetical protein